MKTIQPAALLIGAVLLASPALAQDAPLEGMIIANDGGKVTVRTAGADAVINVDDSSKIRGTGGFLGMDRTPHPPSDLIRGLAVKSKTSDDGVVSVTFKEKDFKTAQQIHAGLYGTEQRVATNAAGVARNAEGVAMNATGVASNSQRLDNVGEMMAAGRTKVFFAVGSSKLTAQGEQDLQAIAAQAKGIRGSRLVVVGRADPTGGEANNQRLSEARAEAVTSYLLKTAGITPDRILPAQGLGESAITQDPDAPATPEEARRVTVTIAVSKASASR